MTALPPPRPPDWADTVTGRLRAARQPGKAEDRPRRTAREIFLSALADPPKWLGALMVLRNAAVAPFGLRTAPAGAGHFLSRLPVVADTPDRYETGLADRHLTFTLALRRRGDRVALTTAIWFNHALGRVYLTLVMPGHLLATRQIVARVATDLRRHRGACEGARP